MKFAKHLLPALALLAFSQAKAQVNITDSMTAFQLVQTLVGTGISFSNPVLDCPGHASGIFTVVSSNLGINDGIILTTGRAETDLANNLPGANGSQVMWFPAECNETFSGEREDSALTAISGVPTHDKCILEFDFEPDGDSLIFDYVFGSEEYDNFSCSGFNDAFAFFLSGPGIVGTPNIALIPGTTIPVAINSTTDPAVTQPSGLGPCQAMGPGSPFSQYYNDNSNGSSITYYGLTTVLTARAAVIPCTTYHIKLAIADGGDCSLDSGVFLEANSFRSTNIKLDFVSSLSGVAGTYNYLVEGCTEATVQVKRNTAFPIPQTVKLGYSGSATRNVDYSVVPDTIVIPANDTVASFSFSIFQDNVPEGLEEVTVIVLNPCTGAPLDSITFPMYDYLPYTFLVDDTALCANEPVRLEVDGDTNFNWFWRGVPAGNITDPGKILTYGYPDTTTTYIVSAEFQGCVTDTSTMLARVEPIPIVDIFTEDTSLCLGEPLALLNYVGPDYFTDYTYLWVPNTALEDPFVKEAWFYTETAGVYKYVLAAQTPLGCTGYDSITVNARPDLELYNVTPEVTAKYGSVVQLNADGALIYSWTPSMLLDYSDIKNPKATAWDTATFMVIGMNEWGCRDTGFVKMNIDYGMHENIPSAFTPNNDGLNDIFRIGNIHFQRLLEFRIFNRWGQEVYYSTDPNKGWDGTYNGVPQDMGVYQYLIRVTTPEGIQKVYKGDVSLIR